MTSSALTGGSGQDGQQAPAAGAGRPGTGRIGWPVWRLAWVIVFGAFASGLDTSLVNVGLHTIGAGLHAGLPAVQWTATGYLLAMAASLPLAGWLGTRAGAGRLWLGALAAFTLASAACALAPSIAALIGLRVAQGLAGGLLIPAGQTVLGQAAGAHRLGRVMATLGIAVTAAPALGPVAGGLLLDAVSWRWLFAINLPVGVAGLLLGWRYVPRGAVRAVAGLDWPALACVSSGLPLIVYGFAEIPGHPAPVRILPPVAAGAVALTAFAVRSRGRRHPLIDLTLFRSRSFAAATVASGTTGVLMFGSALLFPLYFQLGRHETAIATGLHLLGLAGATAVVLPLTGRLTDRYGGGIAAIGAALALAAVLPFAILPAGASPVVVHILLAAFGAALAVAAVPPGIAAYKSVTAAQLADATTIVNIVQRVGGALGGALFALVLASAGIHAAFWAMGAAGLGALASTAWLAASAAGRGGSRGGGRGGRC